MKVYLIDKMGDDTTPISRARASYEGDKKVYTEEQNNRLLDRLMKEQHLGVLEGNVITVVIETAIPIARQIMRHRTMSYNERSRRYLSGEHTPFTYDYPAVRGEKEAQIELSQDEFDGMLLDHYMDSERLYDVLVGDYGVAKEIARYVLPQGMETRFYMTANLRNWFHFLELRLDPHAQKEVRDVAIEVYKIIENTFPKIMAAYTKYSTKKIIEDVLGH